MQKLPSRRVYGTDICGQEVREIGYDILKIEHLYETYQLHVNIILSIKYELYTYNQLNKAYKYYNSYFEFIFQITSIVCEHGLLQGNFTFSIYHSYIK